MTGPFGSAGRHRGGATDRAWMRVEGGYLTYREPAMRASFRLAIALLAGLPALAAAQPTTPAAGMTINQYLVAGRSRLSMRDADGDGSIERSEFADVGGARRGASSGQGGEASRTGGGDGTMPGGMADRGNARDRMFARYDANGDGKLDKAEIDAMLTARFRRLDADRDGILTEAERRGGRGRAGAQAEATTPATMKPDR